MQDRLSPIHRPDILRCRDTPRPTTVGLSVDEIHSLILETAPQSPKPKLRILADFCVDLIKLLCRLFQLRNPNFGSTRLGIISRK